MMIRNIATYVSLVFSQRTRVSTFAFFFSTAFWSSSSSAYLIDGTKWLRGEAVFYVSIPGLSPSAISWDNAVVEALNNWTANTVFDFTIVREDKDPCAVDGFSTIDFSEDFCGSDFGQNTLAVAVRRFERQELGPDNIIESDIVVNAAEKYDIFDGPLSKFGLQNGGLDFKRIALHELGHVIGLDHEETNTAIMAPTISDVFELQEDDISGVEALYSGLKQCAIKRLIFGSTNESLNNNDCMVQELTVGGSDDSYIDLYQFEVSQQAQFEFSASSKTLDTVLLLATEDLEYLAVETSSIDDCDSTLIQELGVGSYFLMVNTWDIPVKADCGVVGDYTLTVNFSSQDQPQLGPPTSLLGSFSEASFSGGISADGGLSFSNAFSPTDSLDIAANITVDTSHVGQPGFLVVAALLPDQLLMLNDRGQFVDRGSTASPLVVFKRKLLEESEHLTIAQDLIPLEVGVIQLEANIFVGYGLEAEPDEVHYHATPMNLIVR
ncbi:MAG: hypothetical protein CMO40_00030 [Verrucomicrobiaceae bacterium]|nr:hypothetical protein [Verrucomicrobiaceae bacterium]